MTGCAEETVPFLRFGLGSHRICIGFLRFLFPVRSLAPPLRCLLHSPVATTVLVHHKIAARMLLTLLLILYSSGQADAVLNLLTVRNVRNVLECFLTSLFHLLICLGYAVRNVLTLLTVKNVLEFLRVSLLCLLIYFAYLNFVIVVLDKILCPRYIAICLRCLRSQPPLFYPSCKSGRKTVWRAMIEAVSDSPIRDDPSSIGGTTMEANK